MTLSTELPATDVAAVKASYARCISLGFLDKFYQKFLASSPEITTYFKKTDFTKQKELLKHGIHLLIMHAEGKTAGTHGMERIRASHSRERLDIKPRLYRFWTESFIATLRELDPSFNQDLERQWKRVVQNGVDFIQSGY